MTTTVRNRPSMTQTNTGWYTQKNILEPFPSPRGQSESKLGVEGSFQTSPGNVGTCVLPMIAAVCGHIRPMRELARGLHVKKIQPGW